MEDFLFLVKIIALHLAVLIVGQFMLNGTLPFDTPLKGEAPTALTK